MFEEEGGDRVPTPPEEKTLENITDPFSAPENRSQGTSEKESSIKVQLLDEATENFTLKTSSGSLIFAGTHPIDAIRRETYTRVPKLDLSIPLSNSRDPGVMGKTKK